MKFTIVLMLLFAFGANATPCEKEHKALDAIHKTLDQSTNQLNEMQKQTESLSQRIRDHQKTCGSSSDAKCNPTEMQMMTGNYSALEGLRQKAAVAMVQTRDKEEAAKTEFKNCLNKASREKEQKKAQP
jgi:hypothetical protein